MQPNLYTAGILASSLEVNTSINFIGLALRGEDLAHCLYLEANYIEHKSKNPCFVLSWSASHSSYQ